MDRSSDMEGDIMRRMRSLPREKAIKLTREFIFEIPEACEGLRQCQECKRMHEYYNFVFHLDVCVNCLVLFGKPDESDARYILYTAKNGFQHREYAPHVAYSASKPRADRDLCHPHPTSDLTKEEIKEPRTLRSGPSDKLPIPGSSYKFPKIHMPTKDCKDKIIIEIPTAVYTAVYAETAKIQESPVADEHGNTIHEGYPSF